MEKFLNAKFIGCSAPTLFCSQRDSPEKNLFDCLGIYPSGIPNNKFAIDFSYSYKGK